MAGSAVRKRRHRWSSVSGWYRLQARCWRSWTRRCSHSGECAASGGRRVGRGLLPVLVPQPRARAPGCGDRPRGASRRLRDRERRCLSAVPRVRAIHDGCMNAFVGPRNGRYLDASAGRSEAGRRRQAARDDVQRRGRQCRSGGREAGDASSLRPGSGRSRRGLGRTPPGRHRLITFDMGGTSADIGIVTELGVAEASARDTEVGRVPAPRSDDRRAHDRRGRRLDRLRRRGRRVPRRARSAGAVPGPACYGLGGDEPTITDATSCSVGSTRRASSAAR